MSQSIFPLLITNTFIPSLWRLPTEALTREYADLNYVKFPIAQGSETFPANLSVSGTTSLGLTNINNNSIVITDGTTTNTINKTGYTTKNSVQDIAHYINFSDSSSTGVGAIQKSANLSVNPFQGTLTTSGLITANGGVKTSSSGINNIFLGIGLGATPQPNNIAIGATLPSIQASGEYNTIIGTNNAAAAMTTGTQNVAIGSQVLSTNTTGNQNTILGAFCMKASSIASFNTAIGRGAMENTPVATATQNCVAVGVNSLANVSGNQNTALGSNTLNSLTTGTNNVAIGNSAYFGGNYNFSTAIGSATSITGDSAIAIGYNATAAANQIVLGDTAGSGSVVIAGSRNITLGNGAVTPTAAVQLGGTSVAGNPGVASFTSGTSINYGTFTNLPAGTYMFFANMSYTTSTTTLTRVKGFIEATGVVFIATSNQAMPVGGVVTSDTGTINLSATYNSTTTQTFKCGVQLNFTGTAPQTSNNDFQFKAVRIA